jgi:hypothetical protein
VGKDALRYLDESSVESDDLSIIGYGNGDSWYRRRCMKQPPGSRADHRKHHRWGQPGQQHGRRIPSLSSEHTLSTCSRLVSSFLTEMVQQIHSLRASGVMSSHGARAFASDASAFRRSAGRLCTTPSEIRTVAIAFSHFCVSLRARPSSDLHRFAVPQILYEIYAGTGS